jgi:EEF1A N-terminal glycine/lysine methyltransferase
MWGELEEEVPSIVHISDELQVQLFTAEEDCNAQKKTLFATHVWSGSVVLAKALAERKASVQNARMIEFGAAAGLPSITAAKLGAALVCSTDFPSPTVLQTLQRNISINNVDEKVIVKSHIWGESVQPLLEANGQQKFDIALAAECLWRHESHNVLLRSILSVLKPKGLLIITYSHHIPGLENDDDHFIRACQDAGMLVVERSTIAGKHMWSDRMVDIFIVVLQQP